MTGFKFGDIILVAFPFTDQTTAKQRPAAVISSDAYNRERPDLIILALTGRVRQPLGFGEALVQDWRAAGLLKPSVMKPIVTTLERPLVRKQLGRLTPPDTSRLREVLSRIIG